MLQSKNSLKASEVSPGVLISNALRNQAMVCCGLSILASVLCALVMPWDLQLSSIGRQLRLPGDIRRAIDLSETFAHGMGCTAILSAVLLANSRRWQVVLFAASVTATSGIVANLAKSGFVRLRPYAVEALLADDSVAVNFSNDSLAQIDFLGEGNFWDASQRSFPSGHSATAWGLAIGLSLLHPSASKIYVVFAVAASFQRLTSGAHYPSDILAGAAIAMLVAAAAISCPWGVKILREDALRRE